MNKDVAQKIYGERTTRRNNKRSAIMVLRWKNGEFDKKHVARAGLHRLLQRAIREHMRDLGYSTEQINHQLRRAAK